MQHRPRCMYFASTMSNLSTRSALLIGWRSCCLDAILSRLTAPYHSATWEPNGRDWYVKPHCPSAHPHVPLCAWCRQHPPADATGHSSTLCTVINAPWVEVCGYSPQAARWDRVLNWCEDRQTWHRKGQHKISMLWAPNYILSLSTPEGSRLGHTARSEDGVQRTYTIPAQQTWPENEPQYRPFLACC